VKGEKQKEKKQEFAALSLRELLEWRLDIAQQLRKIHQWRFASILASIRSQTRRLRFYISKFRLSLSTRSTSYNGVPICFCGL